MKIDKIKIYTFEIVLLIILFFTLFVPNILTRVAFSFFITVYAIVCKTQLKKKDILSIYKKQVTIFMLLFGLIYLIAFYLMGLYFGYYNATVKFSLWSIINYIIPLTLIIISSEIIRSIFLAQKGKLSRTFTFVSMVLIDLIIYINVYDLKTLDGFLNIVGFTFFASIACNLLYNYISKKFGKNPIIVFRLITVLYAYIIPIIPNVYIFFRSFLRMIYPYIIYLILERSYSQKNFATAYKEKRKNIISTVFVIVGSIIVIMLISCKFKYGVLVIGSESMTGAINKGDVVFFESYDGEKIEKGQVIIFEKDQIKMVHRVVDIKLVNGEYRYITQGDANDKIDDGYVTSDKIVGITKFRIIYIGYPTIWVRDIFQ